MPIRSLLLQRAKVIIVKVSSVFRRETTELLKKICIGIEHGTRNASTPKTDFILLAFSCHSSAY
jgi:hypothetical protein